MKNDSFNFLIDYLQNQSQHALIIPDDLTQEQLNILLNFFENSHQSGHYIVILYVLSDNIKTLLQAIQADSISFNIDSTNIIIEEAVEFCDAIKSVVWQKGCFEDSHWDKYINEVGHAPSTIEYKALLDIPTALARFDTSESLTKELKLMLQYFAEYDFISSKKIYFLIGETSIKRV